MPSVRASIRQGFCAIAGGLALLSTAVVAQELPASEVSGEDIRRALIWTGDYSMMSQGDPATVFRDAYQHWQKSKGYPTTDTLPVEQMPQLLAEGAKKRDAFGCNPGDYT